MASGAATVKAVLSGDTVVLVGRASSGPPLEITITLSYVQCPKIARGPSQVDEPFAWESREFLRALCVGKKVTFKVTQTVLSINRTFGDVFLDEVPLTKLVVEHGWASLKSQRDSSSDDEFYEELVELNNAAKANNLGIYNKNQNDKKASVRTIDWTLDASKYFETLLGGHKVVTPSNPIIIDVIIEHIRDGASFRCYVPNDSCYVTFALAGATCPRVNSSSGNGNGSAESTDEGSSPEPFALQSKLFAEMRLLNRRLELAVQGLSSGRGESMLLGTVLHPRGNITVEIVKAGLAKVADWTLAMLPKEGVISLREAENDAKRNRRGIWVGYISPQPPSVCRTFEATVIEVVSGDTVMVLEKGSNVERRVTFSSIRVPRQQAKGASSDPFAVECKEFVRQKLIGKTVTVVLEYERGSETGKDVRQFGSVRYGGRGQDIATQLIQEGLAVTVRHRGDEPRAAAYDMLMVEEVQAVEKKKGMHGPQTKASLPNATPSNDITTDPKKAKAVFATLSKDKTYKGIIEHVFTGSRFKVTIPSENVTLQLALSQVRTPIVTKANSKASASPGLDVENGENVSEGLEDGEIQENPLIKWVEASKTFSRRNLLQRKVDIEISDIDRNGIVLGKIFSFGENNKAKSVAFSLVERGLASVDKYYERRGGQEVIALLDLQSTAQNEKRGMWIVPNAVPTSVKDEEADSSNIEVVDDGDDGAKNMFRVHLTEIYNGASFAVNFVDQPNDADNLLLRGQMKLSEVEEMMRAFAKEADNIVSESVSPSKGMLLAVFHENPSPPEDEDPIGSVWLRALVEEKVEDGRVNVYFVDYGHRAMVSVKDLRALPLPLQHYAPQAVPCKLSFLRAQNVGTDAGVAAARALNSLAWAKCCLIKVNGRERTPPSNNKTSNTSPISIPPQLDVSLYAVESYAEDHLAHATNVGVKLVRHGFLRISTTLARKSRGLGHPKRRGGSKTRTHTETTNETLQELEVAQDMAHKEHLRIWQYGHPGDSDDEDDVRKDDEDKKK